MYMSCSVRRFCVRGDQHLQQVRHALARDGRGGHQRDGAGGVVVVPVELGVHAQLHELHDDPLGAVAELVAAVLVLHGQGRADRRVAHGLPAVAAVDLVERDDERSPSLLEEVDGLDGLGLQPVHQVDHQDRDVAERGAAGTKIREGLVARGVNDQQTRHLDLEGVALLHALRLHHQRLSRELRGADLLRDSAGLSFLHVGVADLVEQLGLPRVHVAHDHRDRRAQVVRAAGVSRGLLAGQAVLARLLLAHELLGRLALHLQPQSLLLLALQPHLFLTASSLQTLLSQLVLLLLPLHLDEVLHVGGDLLLEGLHLQRDLVQIALPVVIRVPVIGQFFLHGRSSRRDRDGHSSGGDRRGRLLVLLVRVAGVFVHLLGSGRLLVGLLLVSSRGRDLSLLLWLLLSVHHRYRGALGGGLSVRGEDDVSSGLQCLESFLSFSQSFLFGFGLVSTGSLLGLDFVLLGLLLSFLLFFDATTLGGLSFLLGSDASLFFFLEFL
jgi:hypothetical protein